ncbi:MAG TPA: ferritin-like domain-containing protein, partial [Spongiibacteraceae bacterium]
MQAATHREQLVGMLCEAAEIEHCLMCTYLYAGLSLKQTADEDLTADELAAVRRWRLEIIRIATDEMLHLALVNNLLIALGARPHYRRFNFPISSHLFPADIAVALLPFDESTLDHFVYLERPLGTTERDSEHLEKIAFPRIAIADRLMSFADDYSTVGELYGAIEDSFAQMIQRTSEAAVFLGPICAQLTQKDFRLRGLCTVASMNDVRGAIELIRYQGEGSATATSGSHYARFCAIRTEWRALKAARPTFVPARTVARNPVMRSPMALDRIQIVAEPA